MTEDSPPPFITFRARVDVYERALELAGHVDRVLDTVPARPRLRALLDRDVLGLVMAIARADADPVRSQRWKRYRDAHASAIEIATVLDLISRQSIGSPDLTAARWTARRLCSELWPLTAGGS